MTPNTLELPNAPEGTPTVEEAQRQHAGESESPRGHYVLGLAYYRQRDYDSAAKHLEKALRSNPRHPGALFFAGFAQEGRGDKTAAEAMFVRLTALDIPPVDKARTYAEIGWLRSMQRRDLEAIAAYDKALALDPKQFTANFYRSLVLADSDRYEEAIEGLTRFEKICESKTDRAKVLSVLGEMWERRPEGKADKQKALAYYKQAVQLNPQVKVAGAGIRRLSDPE